MRMSPDQKLLLVRRIAIVAGVVFLPVILFALFRDVLGGVNISWRSGRLPHTDSNLGLFFTFIVFAGVGAYWAIRNWNPRQTKRRQRTR